MAGRERGLDDILAESASLLAEGETDAASLWRNPTLITLGLDGTPQARTVVLRRFDLAARQLETHTDSRSAKYRELQAHPAASLHGWDPARRVQLRLAGSVTLHTADAVADTAWALLRPKTRETYTVTPSPGTVLSAPSQTGRASEAAGRAVFCVVLLTFDKLEYVNLAEGGHRRASFAWTEAGRMDRWLVP